MIKLWTALPSEPATDLQLIEQVAKHRSEIERRETVSKWIEANLPDFIYFDEYGLLETRINLPTYMEKTKKASADPKIRTQMALFEWAGLDPKEILDLGKPRQENEPLETVQRRKEERATLLESASYSLTGDWESWWSQRRHELHIEADGDDLVLRVSDNENPWRVDFQERSRGFQWFFSFYLTFLVESKKAHRGAVLLLDEPGLHLHVSAQRNLLAFFRRVAESNQILFSSHSPFMIDPHALEDVRTVYRNAGSNGRLYTEVSPGTAPKGDHDTVLPLQAALGYELSQTLFLGKKTLVVEGITDYWILKSLSLALATKGRASLPADVEVIFAGGTSKMLPLVSLFARPDDPERRLVVLLDADRAGLDKANQLKRDLLQRSQEVALVSDPDLLGAPDTEVEDLIPQSEMLAALMKYKGAFKQPSTKPTTNVQLLKKIYEANSWGDFNSQEKSTLLLRLVDGWRSDSPPSAGLLDNAEKLLKGLASRFAT